VPKRVELLRFGFSGLRFVTEPSLSLGLPL
jgi:hypothetical protein